MLEKIVEKAKEVGKKIEEGLEKNIYAVAGICCGGIWSLYGTILLVDKFKFMAGKNEALNSLAQTVSNPQLYSILGELTNLIYSPEVWGTFFVVTGIGIGCYSGWQLYRDIKHNKNLKYKEETK